MEFGCSAGLEEPPQIIPNKNQSQEALLGLFLARVPLGDPRMYRGVARALGASF